MLKLRLILTCMLSVIVVFQSVAQITIQGTIKNENTGESLPYANISLEGTFKGTISNKDGDYIFEVKQLPATIKVRYIGYISKRVPITKDTPKNLDILLKPTIIPMKALVVTAEDPGMTIMREVIRRKKIWRKNLLTYSAEAYTRMGLENDTSIVFISESTTEVYWDKNRGSREVLKSRRETANIKSQEIFAAASYLPNFYDDDVEIQGTRVIGPTHPDALKHYRFKLIGQRSLDDKIVFDISVQPKSKLQPTFVGRVSVLDIEYGMIDVDLKPSKAVIMPFPIKDWNVYHKQQFNDFGQDVWLPLDVRIGGDILISMPGIHFPRIKYNQLSKITNYAVNVILPDSLYKSKRILTIDSLSIKRDTLLVARADMIPLTAREVIAYETIDSTMTLEKAFQPTGFIAWLVRLRVETGENEPAEKPETKKTDKKVEKEENKSKKILAGLLSGFSPQFVYNRVDALHVGFKYQKPIVKNLNFNMRGAYKTGLKRWSSGISLNYYFGKRRNTMFSIGYLNNTDTRYDSDNYPIFYNSFTNLLGFEDYFDYYWNKRIVAEFSRRIRKIRSKIIIGVHDEIHSSIPKTSDYDFVGSDLNQRINPQIQQGRLRSAALRLDIGEEWVPWGIIGQYGARLKLEYSNPEIISSDYSFTKLDFFVNWRIVTYLKRRLLPNVLDLRLAGGTATGELPVQKFGILDVRSGAFSPFGVFKTLGVKPYEGEKYLALFWEHNFRTIPFELLGIDYLVTNGVSFIIHGASGRTWISDSILEKLEYQPQYLDEIHHEIGISINTLFGFMRLDITKPLNHKGVYLGFGIARIF